MRSKIILLSLFGALGSIAWAQSATWTDYEESFPVYPCQDGWVACLQSGSALDPDVQTDGKGMPVSADMRVGWFDLEPTGNFSPFVTLSKYDESAQPMRVGDDAVATNDGGGDPDGTDGGNEAGNDGANNDGNADAVEFFDPEAERARIDANKKRLAELEAKRAEETAREEAARARQQADQAKREAEQRAKAADAALAAAQKAQDAAEKKRLEEQAARAREEQERAAKAAADAERLRKEREAQEAAERKRAAEAAAAAKKAEAERKKREAEEARKAEEARQAEAAARAKAEADAKAAADAARAKAEEEAAREAAEAKRKAEEAAARAKAAADEAERKKAEEEARKAEEDRKKAEEAARAKAEAAAKAAEEAARAKAEAEAKARADAERKRLEEEKARIAAEQKAEEGGGEEEGGGPAVAGAGDCSDLVALETNAILGKLSGDQTSCLEGSLKSSTRMTQKSKISRMLMVNAFSAGDTKTWEGLIKRHLQEIEQSDPDLCYKYALHLSKKGPGSAYGVIRWANVALENRTVWTGNTYTSRVYSLYKIRAAAAQKIWQDLENKHASNPSEDSNKKVKDARNQTKVFAREWYEYAKVAGKDVTTALDLCMSAAGTKDYCEAG